MDFPQYRKSFDDKSFYKVINEETLEEVQILGEKRFVFPLKATKYFEKLLIQEILSFQNERYKASTAVEYEYVKSSGHKL